MAVYMLRSPLCLLTQRQIGMQNSSDRLEDLLWLYRSCHSAVCLPTGVLAYVHHVETHLRGSSRSDSVSDPVSGQTTVHTYWCVAVSLLTVTWIVRCVDIELRMHAHDSTRHGTRPVSMCSKKALHETTTLDLQYGCASQQHNVTSNVSQYNCMWFVGDWTACRFWVRAQPHDA
jgi:hypothetical protein